MWQSNDPISLKCQQLAQTPQGKFEISKYNCMNAYDGAPLKEFVYTPESDSNWENARNFPDNKVVGTSNSLCGF